MLSFFQRGDIMAFDKQFFEQDVLREVQKRHLNAPELSRLMGVSPPTAYRIIKGNMGNINADTFARCCVALHLDPDQYYVRSDRPRQEDLEVGLGFDLTRFTNDIKATRATRGLSQKDLAEALNITRQHINRLENQEVGMTAEMAFRIADQLDFRAINAYIHTKGETS